MNSVLAVAIVLCFSVSFARADTLYGTIKYKDGSKDKGVSAITTSWNKQRGKHDGKGNYVLDFKGKVGKKITVYVNGTRYREIEVKGDTKLDITIPK
jgi:hypothetical protein